MKKALIVAALASAATLTYAASKTVTFDFSDPTKYGYEKAAASAGTTIAYEGTIVSDGVTITNTYEGSAATTFRFYTPAEGAVTLRLALNGVFTVTAGGANITKIDMTGSKLTTTNLSITPGTFENLSWTGSATTVTFTRLKETLQFATMSVTFEDSEDGESGGETGSEETGLEQYRVGTYDEENNAAVLGEEWVANEDSTKASVVTVNTGHMTMTAVSGPISHNVKTLETGLTKDDQPVYLNYWDNMWVSDKKNDYCDANGDTVKWALVKGYGTPIVGIKDSCYWQDDKSRWTYGVENTYYQPDGSLGLPINGSYFTFTPSVDGKLAAFVMINKSNRKFYVVDEETKVALDTTQYYAEGCVNGQKTEDGSRLLFQRLRHGVEYVTEVKGTTTDEGGNEITLYDTIAINPNYVIEHPTQLGRQNIWCWINVNVKANQTIWMFIESAQLALGGYDFTYEAEPAGIEELASDKQPSSKAIFDLTGRRASALQSGKAYIVGGKAVIIR